MTHATCQNVFPHPDFVTALCERSLPTMLVLDVVNYCNLDCVHCPQKAIQKQPGFVARRMHLDWVHRMAQEVSQYTAPILVRVAGDGEPLLHPDCLDMVQAFAPLPHTITDITTNGLLLTRERAATLLGMGLDIISISLDALTASTYSHVRRGGEFSRVVQNIFALLELRESMRSPTKLLVSFIVQEENREEAEMFQRFWEPLADFVIMRRLHSAGSKIKQDETATQNSPAERYPCPHPFKRLAVNFNGSISYCAHDWDDSAVLGNIREMSIAQAWRSPALTQLRLCLLEGRPIPDTACGQCRDWASTRWDFGYELLVDRVLQDPSRSLLPHLPILATAPRSLEKSHEAS